MSQLFDYFVCSPSAIEEWADAMERGDEELQEELESRMPRSLALRGIGQDEFSILAGCLRGGAVDIAGALERVDFVRAIDEEEGPWISAFRRAEIEAIAGMGVDEALIGRWSEAVAEYRGMEENDDRRGMLTAEVAEDFKGLCRAAIEGGLDVFVCFYG